MLEDEIKILEKESGGDENLGSNYAVPGDLWPVEKPANTFEEAPGKFRDMMEKAFKNVNDNLKVDTIYYGTISSVSYECDSYKNIIVQYQVMDEGQAKYVNDIYSFGGQWDILTAKRLGEFVKKINNFYVYDLNLNSPETVADSLKVLIGARIMLKRVNSYKNRIVNEVCVIGKYNREERKMEVSQG